MINKVRVMIIRETQASDVLVIDQVLFLNLIVVCVCVYLCVYFYFLNLRHPSSNHQKSPQILWNTSNEKYLGPV